MLLNERKRVAFCSYPSVPKGTKAVIKVEPAPVANGHAAGPLRHGSGWDAHLERRAGQRADLRVRVPHDVPVGLWRLTVATSYGDRASEVLVHRSKDPLYILFNPFNECEYFNLLSQASSNSLTGISPQSTLCTCPNHRPRTSTC